MALLTQMRGHELLAQALVRSHEKHKTKSYRTISHYFKEVVVVVLAVVFLATQLSAAELKSRISGQLSERSDRIAIDVETGKAVPG